MGFVYDPSSEPLMYVCAGVESLSEKATKDLASQINCSVGFISKNSDFGEWTYILKGKRTWTEEDLRIIQEKGLTLLVDEEHLNRIAEFVHPIKIAKYSVILMPKFYGSEPDSSMFPH